MKILKLLWPLLSEKAQEEISLKGKHGDICDYIKSKVDLSKISNESLSEYLGYDTHKNKAYKISAFQAQLLDHRQKQQTSF